MVDKNLWKFDKNRMLNFISGEWPTSARWLHWIYHCMYRIRAAYFTLTGDPCAQPHSWSQDRQFRYRSFEKLNRDGEHYEKVKENKVYTSNSYEAMKNSENSKGNR